MPNPSPLPAPQVLTAPALYNADSRSNLAPQVAQGSTVSLVLVGGDIQRGVTATFSGAGVTARPTAWWGQIDEHTAVTVVIVEVAPNAPLGDRSLLLTNPGGIHGPAAPGMLEVVAAGSIPAPQVKEHALFAERGEFTAAQLEPRHRTHKRRAGFARAGRDRGLAPIAACALAGPVVRRLGTGESARGKFTRAANRWLVARARGAADAALSRTRQGSTRRRMDCDSRGVFPS